MTLAQKPKKIPAGDSQQTSWEGGEKGLTGHYPQLPEHDEGTSDSSRGHLGRVDGNCGVLCTDTNAHDKPCSEQSLPRSCESGTDRGGGETASSNENLASTAKVVVEWIDNESTTVYKVSDQCRSEVANVTQRRNLLT